jgi:hypothetical protein
MKAVEKDQLLMGPWKAPRLEFVDFSVLVADPANWREKNHFLYDL